MTYTPTAGFDGTDSFTYTVRTAQGESATNVVTVTVLPADGLVLRGTLSIVTPIDVPQDQRVYTRVTGINDAGQMVGIRDCGDDVCGFRLPPVPADFGVSRPAPQGINNVGQIVGSFGNRDCNIIPVLTDGFLLDTTTNTFTPLNFPGASSAGCPPGNVSFPSGINDAGQIVGTLGGHGFLRDAGTFIMIDVPGAISTAANGINNRGQIVGAFQDASGVSHGFLQDGGTFLTLDVPGAVSTVANGINNGSKIVGTFQDASGVANGVFHGFLWDAGTFTTFDIPESISTMANGINNRGQIVGSFLIPQPPPDTGVLTRGYVATPASQ